MKSKAGKKRRTVPKTTTPQCVEMMRAIRTALFADYLKMSTGVYIYGIVGVKIYGWVAL